MTEVSAIIKPYLRDMIRRLDVMRCVDPQSRQHGCMDREFWNYRTTRGFSSAPLQHAMGAYSLTGVLKTGEDRAMLVSTAEQLARFWVISRNKNGSVNEWFRNEQSYCATAMGLHALTETATALRSISDLHRLQPLLVAAISSERWLQSRNNPLAMNQDVASVSARWSLGTLLGDTRMCEMASSDFSKLLGIAESHGHLLESGGFDIGYTLLALDLLVVAHMNGLDDSKRLAEILCDRLAGVVSRSGDLPFALGSRGTSHRFFGGIHYFARTIDWAAHLVTALREDHLEQQAKFTQEYDDRYLATFASTALARTASYATHDVHRSSSSHLRQSNLSEVFERIELSAATVFCNRKLGSSICYIDSEHRTLSHLGYSIAVPNKKRLCTLSVGDVATGSTSHALVPMSQAMPLVRGELVFRLITVLSRIPVIARLVSLTARTRLARPGDRASATFVRTFEATTDRVVVVDRVHVSNRLRSGRISPLLSFPFHSPSALGVFADLSVLALKAPENATVGDTFVRRWTVAVVNGRPVVSEIR